MNKQIEDLTDAIGQVLLGKNHQVKLALACLFARGHLLIEDLPGMGKTTLAQCLAKVLGLHYERIQFTSDLLPADILGVSIFDQNTSEFRFHKGPIFSQVLLADEINRSTPKSQSALLEAMEEKQVTTEGSTRQLPKPFFVIATQNPLSQAGTYPLPESQLDRFLLRISLGYPSRAAEKMLFKGVDPRQRLADMQPIVTLSQLDAIQTHIDSIQATDSVLDYLQRLVDFTRYDSSFSYGISPRGALALLKSAKAWAFIHNRDHVVPEDMQAVLEPVVGHRIRGTGTGVSGAGSLSDYLVKNVDVINS